MSLTRMNSQKPGYQEKKTYAKLLVLWLLIGADLMPYGSVVMGSLRPFYLTCTTSITHNSRQKALRGEYLKPRLSVLVWKMLSVIKARPKREKPMSMATPVQTQRRYTTTALLPLLDSPKSNTKVTIDEWLRSLAADVPYRRKNQLSGNSQSKLGCVVTNTTLRGPGIRTLQDGIRT